jgi:molybdopterin-containing oxidoreductase family iron-sulfur binding subunit
MAGASALAAAAGSAGCGAVASRRRLAMAIDTRTCLEKDGCRACVEACHRAHNVPSIAGRQHEVKWIWKQPVEKAFGQDDPRAFPASLRGHEVLVFCNHCDNPPCVRVCPTQATWKRDDGIVTIDEHRCIGCRYCVAACPYGSRSFNWSDPRPHIARIDPAYPTRTTGVVEKCTLCEERLADGRPPACVEACPEGALVFGDLREPSSEVSRVLDAHLAIRRKPELGTRPQVYYVVS